MTTTKQPSKLSARTVNAWAVGIAQVCFGLIVLAFWWGSFTINAGSPAPSSTVWDGILLVGGVALVVAGASRPFRD